MLHGAVLEQQFEERRQIVVSKASQVRNPGSLKAEAPKPQTLHPGALPKAGHCALLEERQPATCENLKGAS